VVDDEQRRVAQRLAFAFEGDAEDREHLPRPPADALAPRGDVERRKREQDDREAVQPVADGVRESRERAHAPHHDGATASARRFEREPAGDERAAHAPRHLVARERRVVAAAREGRSVDRPRLVGGEDAEVGDRAFLEAVPVRLGGAAASARARRPDGS
jgi:hypothetical protein